MVKSDSLRVLDLQIVEFMHMPSNAICLYNKLEGIPLSMQNRENVSSRLPGRIAIPQV